jgi:hypothetical protein
MVICEDAWLIRPFSKMDGADKNENILLSNITSIFKPWSNDEIAVARSRLEKWSLKNNWNWSAWDS